MLVGVPTGIRYSTTISQITKVNCICERCSTNFECEMFTEGSGHAVSSSVFSGKEAAKEEANQNAQESFEKSKIRPSMLPSKCPACGHYQQAMVDYHQGTIFPYIYALSVGILFVILLVATIFAISFSIQSNFKDAASILDSKVFWASIAIPGAMIIFISILRKNSDLNQKNPMIKRIKRPSV